ncbi:MAG: hypothetical protein Ct9H300mP14_08710 [Gammaproteobacteria bacterium]|nr:MAG: hypothetical protein Ct9H300mP14_08710 [Gammaproteobacteria bacterium]
MVQGVVKRVGHREAIVDIESVEASLPRSTWIDREALRTEIGLKVFSRKSGPRHADHN